MIEWVNYLLFAFCAATSRCKGNFSSLYEYTKRKYTLYQKEKTKKIKIKREKGREKSKHAYLAWTKAGKIWTKGLNILNNYLSVSISKEIYSQKLVDKHLDKFW